MGYGKSSGKEGQTRKDKGGDAATGAVLVVGGGIAGIQASLDLAESGYRVYLVENNSAIGGTMAQLDKTFPTNDCSMCILSPKLVETGRHANIALLTCTGVKEVKGEAGNFTVTLVKKPRFVDMDKCIACGLCAEKCPGKVPNEYDGGISLRKAIYVRYPQAVPLKYTIDPEHCIRLTKGKCGTCEKVCPAGAINFEDAARELDIGVGAVILAPGFAPGNPSLCSEYGYGRYPNVVSSLEFERMLSASGPYEGRLMRPSDRRIPEKIAFIQCAGSRDIRHSPYCSSVCCMYAVKQAVIAGEHAAGVRPHIFYMDLRAFGKEFEEYYARARDEYGVQFVRSRVASVQEVEGGSLLLRYESGDRAKEDVFDLVVLSTGLSRPKESDALARVFGIDLNEYGFARTDMLKPLETSRPGVFVCGAFSGPKDIPDTAAQASGAAAKAAALIAKARDTLVSAGEMPPERDVLAKTPRIGVFVCHCGINIGGVVDVPSVTRYARTLPGVRYAEDNLYTCSQDTQERIKAMIAEHDLNRVVVASCTPRTHEPLFQKTLREAGLNPYLFEFVNVREQCSWVHMHEPEAATEKAKDLVRIGIARAAWLRPLERVLTGVTPVALVIGGGLAGMTAALEISLQGFEVHLVEKTGKLGGNLNLLSCFIDGSDPRAKVEALVRELKSNERVHVYLESQVTALDGYIGNYRSTVRTAGGGDVRIEHGVVVVATGGVPHTPDEYLYGKDPRVLTQLELEDHLSGGKVDAATVVMIGCVGSRQEGRPYCSRICCTHAVKNALEVKRLSPDTDVYVINRDVRVYGFKERYYTEARENGVRFIRYDVEQKPVVTIENGMLRVTCMEPTIGEELTLDADLVVLSVPVVPGVTNIDLARMLKVPLNKDGFFLEAHMKLRPVEFATDGVYLCGLAHAPKLADESIAQACGAAAKACIVLTKQAIEGEGMIARVYENLCSGCGLCVELCPYGAISLSDATGKASVNPALCKCCGACAGGCRMGAIQQAGLDDRELIEVLDAAL